MSRDRYSNALGEMSHQLKKYKYEYLHKTWNNNKIARTYRQFFLEITFDRQYFSQILSILLLW